MDDKEFIMCPELWPRWPVLPIKRFDEKNRELEVGVMRAVKGEIGTTVYLIGMYGITKDTDWKTVPKLVYEDVDKLLADGWIVD